MGGNTGHVPHSFESLNWCFCYTTPLKQKLHSIVVKTCDGAEVCDVPLPASGVVTVFCCHSLYCYTRQRDAAALLRDTICMLAVF